MQDQERRARQREKHNKQIARTQPTEQRRTAREQAAQQIHVLRNHGATGRGNALLTAVHTPYRYPYTPLQCHPRSVLVEPPLGASSWSHPWRPRREGERERARDELLHTALYTALVAPCPVRLLEPGPPSLSLSPILSPSFSPSFSPIPARARREPGPILARSRPDAGPASRSRGRAA